MLYQSQLLEWVKMESLQLKTEYRDTLYFNKYKYKATVKLPFLRNIIYDKKLRFQLDKPSYYETNTKFLEWRDYYKDLLTIRVEGSNTSIFSNEIDILKSVESITTIKSIYTAVASAPTGVKYFKNAPKHKYRVYFKSKPVFREFINDVLDLIKRYNSTDCALYPSTTFENWLQRNSKLTQRYLFYNFFMDFDEEKMITFLQFTLGDNVRVFYKLEKRP